MQKEILTKPFSYCLPGHRKIPRNIVFWVGVVFNGLLSLLFLAYPGLDTISSLIAVCSAFFMGMTVYALTVWFIFAFRQGQQVFGFLLWMVFFVLSWIEGHVYLERMIIHSPLLVIAFGTFTCAALWKYLSNDDLHRRFCGTLVLGVFGGWDRKKQQQFKEAEAVRRWSRKQEPNSARIENFFLSRMKTCKALSRGRYLWGMLYADWGRWADGLKDPSGWKFFPLILLLIAFFGYFPHEIADYIFLFPISYTIFLSSRLPSSILLPRGRRDRFSGSIIQSVIFVLVISAMAIVIAMLFVALSSIMPEIPLRTQHLVFHTMNLKLFYVPLLIMPLGLAASIFLTKNTPVMMIPLIAIFVNGKAILGWLAAQPAIIIIGMLAGSWVVLCLATYYKCMRLCLVGQERRR